MADLRTLTIVMAGSGATVAVLAALGKFSGHLRDRMVDRLYYVSYACTGLSIVLFVVQGLFGSRS